MQIFSWKQNLQIYSWIFSELFKLILFFFQELITQPEPLVGFLSDPLAILGHFPRLHFKSDFQKSLKSKMVTFASSKIITLRSKKNFISVMLMVLFLALSTACSTTTRNNMKLQSSPKSRTTCHSGFSGMKVLPDRWNCSTAMSTHFWGTNLT